MLEAGALHLARSRTTQILIDNLDALEAELARMVGQTVLTSLALLVMNNLAR